MANKTTANAFMASAQKSKREMADIQKEGSGKHETDEVELKKISLLIPAWLHKEAQLHRVETGESICPICGEPAHVGTSKRTGRHFWLHDKYDMYEYYNGHGIHGL